MNNKIRLYDFVIFNLPDINIWFDWSTKY